MNREDMIRQFHDVYGTADGDVRVFRAPGSVRLIGDHTDLTGGHVFSCALSLSMYGAAGRSSRPGIRILSRNMGGGVREIPADGEPVFTDGQDWLHYVTDILDMIRQLGHTLSGGLDILIESGIPQGAGVASSAALEMLTGIILREMYGFADISDDVLTRAGGSAEEHHAGLSDDCLEQYVCVQGKKGCGLFISTARESCEYVPLKFDGYSVVITDSLLRNPVAKSLLEERETEHGKILRKLQHLVNISHICDLELDRFQSVKDVLMNETYEKRAQYLISEDIRTIRAVSAMRVGNLNRFGEFMKESQISIMEDYEISLPELDFLAERAWEIDGVIGSRVTGGGCGRCTVSIVKNEAVGAFCEELGSAYRERFGREPGFYVTETADGAGEVLPQQG